LALLKQESALTRAAELYRGRAFGLATGAAAIVKGDLGIISAGLGYVRGEVRIPSYDLTIRSSGPASVAKRIDGPFDPQAWWESVGNGPYASDLSSECAGRPRVLVCLSRAYASMVIGDLLKIASSSPDCLRIFGLSIGDALPLALQRFVLPYDERLEQMGRPGTRVDFPQRALMDYLENVVPATGIDVEEEIAFIKLRLSSVTPSAPRRQKRIDDESLKRLIADLLPTVGSNCSRMLAHVRRDKGYSCEQGRFATLFRDVCAGVST
jgi:hypothetical protein